MKKIIIFSLLLFVLTNSFSQQTGSAGPRSPEDYLTKSKNQKTTAMIFLIGGSALAASQIMVLAPGKVPLDSYGKHITIGAIGVSAVVGSVILFKASARNRRKSMNTSASINLEKQLVFQHQNITFLEFPAISVKLNL